MESLPARPVGLLALAAFCLSGCARSYYLRDLRSEYQAPEIPGMFGEDKPGFRIAGYAAYARQRAIRFSVDTSYADGYESEQEWHAVHGEASIRRLPSLAGGTVAYLGGPFLAGIAIGIPLENAELGQAGTYFGITPRFGAWTPMLTVGLFVNRVHARLDYITSADAILTGPDILADTLDAVIWDLSVPLKAGLRYRAGPAAIYLLAGRSGTRVWPFLGATGDRYTVKTADASLGLQIWLPHGIGCAVESGQEWVEIPYRLEESHWKGRAFLTLDFPLAFSAD
jgi:hypothetical protein